MDCDVTFLNVEGFLKPLALFNLTTSLNQQISLAQLDKSKIQKCFIIHNNFFLKKNSIDCKTLQNKRNFKLTDTNF